jgi:hypothetical protein
MSTRSPCRPRRPLLGDANGEHYYMDVMICKHSQLQQGFSCRGQVLTVGPCSQNTARHGAAVRSATDLRAEAKKGKSARHRRVVGLPFGFVELYKYFIRAAYDEWV